MPTAQRIQAVWTGFAGAPGYSNFYFYGADLTAAAADLTARAAAVRQFFFAVRSFLPTAVTITVKPVSDIFDMAGPKVNELTIPSPPGAVTGTSAVAYAGGAGVAVNWRSGTFTSGRAVTGRTFLVPMSGVFDLDGTLAAGSLSTIQLAADALVAGTGAVKPYVWTHRPGVSGLSPVTGATIRDRTSILRSRR